jgi:hypothetical protein
MTRVAILDDQHVARRMADWASLPAGTDVVVSSDHGSRVARVGTGAGTSRPRARPRSETGTGQTIG